MKRASLSVLCLLATAAAFAADKPLTTGQVLESAHASDWRRPDPANTLYLELAAGRVIIELAPRFAPLHVANVKTLVTQRYFDGLAIDRVQDNFVAQWGDEHDKPRSLAASRLKIPDESVIAWSKALPFIVLSDHRPSPHLLDSAGLAVRFKPKATQLGFGF
jgi:peptidylprolyl isomerase